MSTDNEPLVNQDIRKLIAIRAYEIWESQGCPHGRDVINWQQAEREIMDCVNQDGANDTRSGGQPSSA